MTQAKVTMRIIDTSKAAAYPTPNKPYAMYIASGYDTPDPSHNSVFRLRSPFRQISRAEMIMSMSGSRYSDIMHPFLRDVYVPMFTSILVTCCGWVASSSLVDTVSGVMVCLYGY